MRLYWIAIIIVVVDQITKMIVRTQMQIGDSIPLVGDWVKLTFTENPGMAFGISLGSSFVVTILAIVATVLIVIYLRSIRNQHAGYRTSLSLILGGAIGNIIDRIFYAKIFDYGEFFHGEVVDFIHFDLWSGRIPEWVPFLGDRYVALFPIWNVADMSIVIGVSLVLIFQKAYHRQRLAEERDAEAEAEEPSGLTEASAVVPTAGGSSTP